MLNSYVGIADRNGLESIWPEKEHVVKFLTLRASRRSHLKAVCFWAVLHEEFAHSIAIELQTGCRRDALILLETLAKEIGPVLHSQYHTDHSALDIA